jgi:hypothetical protein
MAIPLACDLTAIPADQRGAYQALVRDLMGSATSIRDVPDGLVFEWSLSRYESVTRWIDFERRCCPFLTFTLTVSQGQELLAARATGPEGAAAFLRAELNLPTT